MAKSKTKITPAFWIYGNQRQMQKAWNNIVQKIGDPDICVLYCGHNPDNMRDGLLKFATANDIILLLKSRDIFDDRPRIIKMLGLPEDYTLLSDYLHLINDHNILVVYGRPGYRASGKSTKWVPAQASKFYKTIKSSGMVFEFPEDASSDNEAAQWVNEVVEEQGSKIDKDASNRLVRLKGRNLDRLSSEAVRLSLYKNNSNITIDDVNNSCAWSSLETVWEFIDAFDASNVDTALTYLQKFYTVAGQAKGDTFYGEVTKLIGALIQHLYFITMIKGSSIKSISYDSIQKIVDGVMKIKPSESFRLSTGIMKPDELVPWFSNGYIYANMNKSGVKQILGWKLGRICDAFRDLYRCNFLCRKYSDQSYIELCLNTFVLVACGKITSKQAAYARGDKYFGE